MSNIDSPAVARRRVRLALRTAREAKQLTQTQIAQAMDWSLSKVMRIEKGETNVSSGDLRVLLDHLDVCDPDEVQQLVNDARLSRQERWTVDPDDRQHLTAAMLELYQFEAEATTIRVYNHLVIPGILQTRAYANAVFANFRDAFDDADIEARIAMRGRRRQQILYRADAPHYLVILDESVLMRPLGGADVMADQLDELLTTMHETPLVVRILPFVAAARSLAFFGPFTLHDLDDQSALLYREVAEGDDISHAPRELARHRAAFDGMWSLALDGEASVHRIADSAADMRRLAQATPG
jgi:transcriptional regulator with XRE-family HTH domain